jgi:hypothetical protein
MTAEGRLAAHVDVSVRADPRQAYLDRAKLLVPYDATLGSTLHLLNDGQRSGAACRNGPSCRNICLLS